LPLTGSKATVYLDGVFQCDGTVNNGDYLPFGGDGCLVLGSAIFTGPWAECSFYGPSQRFDGNMTELRYAPATGLIGQLPRRCPHVRVRATSALTCTWQHLGLRAHQRRNHRGDGAHPCRPRRRAHPPRTRAARAPNRAALTALASHLWPVPHLAAQLLQPRRRYR
jgi:hypothetical protein